MLMATGAIPTTSAGCGDHTELRSPLTTIGLRIVTDIGHGVRLTAGRGLGMNRGVGRRITTAVGSITTTTGPGFHALNSSQSAVGGDLHSLRLSHSTSPSEPIFAGIHCRTTSAIHIRGATVTMIETRATVGVVAGTAIVDRAMVVVAAVVALIDVLMTATNTGAE